MKKKNGFFQNVWRYKATKSIICFSNPIICSLKRYYENAIIFMKGAK